MKLLCVLMPHLWVWINGHLTCRGVGVIFILIWTQTGRFQLACRALLRGSKESSLAASQFGKCTVSVYRFTRIACWKLLKLTNVNPLTNFQFLPIYSDIKIRHADHFIALPQHLSTRQQYYTLLSPAPPWSLCYTRRKTISIRGSS